MRSISEQRKTQISPSLDTPRVLAHDQNMRMAQYGISHDHAHDKALVLQENESVEFAGGYEPSAEKIKQLGIHEAYKAVHWFSSKEEILEDQSISAIAVTGEILDNLGFAREVVEHGKHVWLDKPAGNDLAAFKELIEIAVLRFRWNQVDTRAAAVVIDPALIAMDMMIP